jgi:1,4-alpha-glucan branching enzyme
MNYDYQWEYLRDHRTRERSIADWMPRAGPVVTARHADGRASHVRFQLLLDNAQTDIYLVGEFNNWGRDESQLSLYQLVYDAHHVWAHIDMTGIEHTAEYKFLVHDKKTGKRQFITDPAGSYFTDSGNAVFWDFEDPSAYTQQHPLVNTFDRATKIVQTDLPGLIAHFADNKHLCGRDVPPREYYRFIADSGVILALKDLGFNTIQFLPFAQSIDGDNWKLRYLVPFQYAIQKNWGTPDDFAYMIDQFHAHDIAVIGDFVLGHIPDRDFKIFGQNDTHHGIHLWKKSDGTKLYVNDETAWGSGRIDFDSPHVREFFIGSTLHFLKHYQIDGFRIDNIDGIIRYGDNGDGPERANGRTFLREMNTAIYAHNPAALIHYEAHYYYGDNSQMLVAPISSHPRALGATAYNSSRLTYDFHTKYMFLSSDEYSVWRIKHIVEEQEWGKSNSTVADFHNHDAAAGLMSMRCTGSYAYDAMLALNEHAHVHIIGKIKAMESVISFGCEGRTLDLIQTFLLQMGTFEHDSSIQWHLTFNEINAAVLRFKQRVNELLDSPAFWPTQIRNRQYLNVDDANKVLVIERSDGEKRFIIVVNLSAWKLQNYKVGLTTHDDMKVIFNSDELQYGGFGMTNFMHPLKNVPSKNFELLNREVEIPLLPPYTTIILVPTPRTTNAQ